MAVFQLDEETRHTENEYRRKSVYYGKGFR